MPAMPRPASIVLLALLASCSVPDVPGTLDRESPPQELGRPGYVRTTARVGSWIGTLVGGVVSIVVLPITWPISKLVDEPLGKSQDEFLFMPLTMGASGGHFLLGAPFDGIDWIFRRAWVGSDIEPGYEFTPMAPTAQPLPPGEFPTTQPAASRPVPAGPATQPAAR